MIMDIYKFDGFMGNEVVKNSLKKYIFTNNIFHSLILQGDKGLGKRTLSKIIAKAILCMDKNMETMECCGKCSSCLKFDENNHPDVLYLKLDMKKNNSEKGADTKKAKSIGVDKVKEIVHKNTEIKPYESKNKIFIIENAELMTVQAQNTLLKTIEEPNKYNIFILLAENEKLFLQTILSRCIMLRLRTVERELCEKIIKIKKTHIGEDVATKYAIFSSGNIGKAFDYIEDETYIELRNQIISILKKINQINPADALMLSKELSEYKSNINEVLDIFLSWYRDLLLVKYKKENIFMMDYRELLVTEKSNYSIKKICNVIDEIEKAKMRIKQNGNLQMILDTLFLQLVKK